MVVQYPTKTSHMGSRINAASTRTLNTGAPSTSNTVTCANYATNDDWDDEEVEEALTQLPYHQEFVETNQQAKKKGPAEYKIREVAQEPKRNFAVNSLASITTTTTTMTSKRAGPNGCNSIEKLVMETSGSKEDVNFLTQTLDAVQLLHENKKLKEDLLVKEGESKILHRRQDQYEKQVQTLMYEITVLKKGEQLKMEDTKKALLREHTQLQSEKKFLEKENKELQRKLKIEQAAKQKAEFAYKSALNKNVADIANDRPLQNGHLSKVGTTNDYPRNNTVASSHKRGQSADLEPTASQFPTKSDFYGQSTGRAADAKRRKFSDKHQRPDDVLSVTVAAPCSQFSQLPMEDECVETDTPPRLVRKFDITKRLKQRRNVFWFVEEA